MNRLHIIAGILFVAFLNNGCGSGLHPKMPEYLGAAKGLEHTGQLHAFASSQPKTGLLIINDTTAMDSAPPLSQDQFAAFTQWVRERINQDFPITVDEIVLSQDIVPNGMVRQFVQAGEARGLDHLVLVILSSSETEVPDQFPLGGVVQGGIGRGRVLGFHAENYAFAEIAILDVTTSHILLQADGQDWASLDRLNVPLASNVYPVIYRAQGTAPIYPTEEDAHDVLRGVAASEAMIQAIMHLKEAWTNHLPT
ncbi:MAG: hypothetical protein GKS05_04450 [Nitrospirales bacterium]|nr:hypothetical protein [Nitrospirales bacterium]